MSNKHMNSAAKSSKNLVGSTSNRGSVGLQPRIDELEETVTCLHLKVTGFVERFERDTSSTKEDNATFRSALVAIEREASGLKSEFKQCLNELAEVKNAYTKLEARLGTLDKFHDRTSATFDRGVADLKSQIQQQTSDIKELLRELKTDNSNKFAEQKAIIEKEKASVVEKLEKLEKDKVDKIEKSVDSLKKFSWMFYGGFTVIGIVMMIIRFWPK